MKFKVSFLAAPLLFVTLAASAPAQLLNDQFNGTAINSTLWQTMAPGANSSITESGGHAISRTGAS